MKLDATHATVEGLRQLLPGAAIAGGAFAGSLSPPATMNPGQRRGASERARELAVEECVGTLLRSIGLPSDVEVPTGGGERRRWRVRVDGGREEKARGV